MPNICTAFYVIEGEKKELDALYETMTSLQAMEQPLVENDFGPTWLGCLVKALGKNPEEVLCRGEWLDLERADDTLRMTFETAWTPCYEVTALMKSAYPSLRIYYKAEEPDCEIYVKNDVEGKYFPETEQDGHSYELMTEEREQLEVKIIKGLQPEDKQWLLDLDCTEADCIVLAGMYRSWRTWEESFTDEDTGETVTIERNEIVDTPLFESHEGEAEALLEKVCKASDTRRKIKYIVWKLSTTPLNYTRLLVDNVENLYGDERLWAYKEIGDLYRWGKEEFGFFIDKQKAKEYYDKAGVTDENPLEDSDKHNDPDPCIYIYTVRGEITPLKELTEKIANKYGDTENELGWYVPMNIFMYYLVRTDPKRTDYCGNLLSAEEKDGALLLKFETERDQNAFFAYALKAKFPELEVEIEEVLYEDDTFE